MRFDFAKQFYQFHEKMDRSVIVSLCIILIAIQQCVGQSYSTVVVYRSTNQSNRIMLFNSQYPGQRDIRFSQPDWVKSADFVFGGNGLCIQFCSGSLGVGSRCASHKFNNFGDWSADRMIMYTGAAPAC